MIAPLFDSAVPGSLASIGIALAIGGAFGWTLERAGLGSARKLAGQFYLTDFTVVKVMFTAIVTAALGVFWLGWIGVLDLARVYVPETFVAPQIVGGLVFGAGFAAAGLCPGTSCVAAASGRRDGLMVVAGLFAGVLLFGLALGLEPVDRFYRSTAIGVRTLPEQLNVSYGWTVFALVLAALGAFLLAERLERARGSAAR
jgi:uncharacterized protein